MTECPEISVLTIVHNGERFIKEAIDSVLSQTCKNFEYIIVDNNSTDNTPGILAEYARKDSRIRIINENNKGILYARNAGLSEAKGEWIAVLDADDVAFPCRLEKQLDFVKKDEGLVLVGGGCVIIDENGRGLKNYIYPSGHHSLLERLEEQSAFFPHSSAFYKRELVACLGGYRFSYAEDYDLWLRLSACGKIASIPLPLIKLRRSTSSNSYNVSQDKYLLHKIFVLVSHMRRKMQLSDVFLAGQEQKDDFMTWLKEQAESLGALKKGRAIRELNRVRHSVNQSKFKRTLRILSMLVNDRHSRAFLFDRGFLKNAAIEIAEASKERFA